MPFRELVKAREVARETFKHHGGTLGCRRPFGLSGAPRQRAAFDLDQVAGICLRPVVGDIIVIDHGNRATLSRVRHVSDESVTTEFAHVAGAPLGNPQQLYSSAPTFYTRATWSNYVRALSMQKGRKKLLFIIQPAWTTKGGRDGT